VTTVTFTLVSETTVNMTNGPETHKRYVASVPGDADQLILYVRENSTVNVCRASRESYRDTSGYIPESGRDARIRKMFEMAEDDIIEWC
jgi:hypothetical protein